MVNFLQLSTDGLLTPEENLIISYFREQLYTWLMLIVINKNVTLTQHNLKWLLKRFYNKKYQLCHYINAYTCMNFMYFTDLLHRLVCTAFCSFCNLVYLLYWASSSKSLHDFFWVIFMPTHYEAKELKSSLVAYGGAFSVHEGL